MLMLRIPLCPLFLRSLYFEKNVEIQAHLLSMQMRSELNV